MSKQVRLPSGKYTTSTRRYLSEWMNTTTDAGRDAVAGQVERPVRPRFCQECQHCGKEPYGRNPTKRVCAAAPARREAHIEARGKTPDAYWTAPDAWVYVNSGFAARCKWFAAV